MTDQEKHIVGLLLQELVSILDQVHEGYYTSTKEDNYLQTFLLTQIIESIKKRQQELLTS